MFKLILNFRKSPSEVDFEHKNIGAKVLSISKKYNRFFRGKKLVKKPAELKSIVNKLNLSRAFSSKKSFYTKLHVIPTKDPR